MVQVAKCSPGNQEDPGSLLSSHIKIAVVVYACTDNPGRRKLKEPCRLLASQLAELVNPSFNFKKLKWQAIGDNSIKF